MGQRGVSIHRDEVYRPHGGRVGQRGGQHLQSGGVLSTRWEGGTERGSTSAKLRCTVHKEGGWDREG